MGSALRADNLHHPLHSPLTPEGAGSVKRGFHRR
jgi:hypothetical protein